MTSPPLAHCHPLRHGGLLDIPWKLRREAVHRRRRAALICKDVTPQGDHLRCYEAIQVVIL